MIYAFIRDEAFGAKNAPTIVRYTDAKTHNPVGVLTDRVFNYFHNPSNFSDPRSQGVVNTRLTLNGCQATGRLDFYYDSNFVDSNIDNIGAIIHLPGDTTQVTTARNELLRRLFNVIEYVYLAHGVAGQPKLQGELNQAMLNENGSFGGYVPNSLVLSAGTTMSTYHASPINTNEYPIYNSFSFSFNFGASIATFKFWINSDSFMTEYPLSTIIKVVYPCEPMRMLHPLERDSQNNTIESLITYEKIGAVIATSKYKDTQLIESITKYDHTGLAQYVTDYISFDLGRMYRMSFSMLYQGAAPTAAVMRAAIRDALLAEVAIGGALLASEQDWRAVFPALFVDAGYYLVPMYYNRINYPGGVTIDRNIMNYTRIMTTVRNLFPQMNQDIMSEQLEMLQAPSSGLYLIALPLEDNGSEHISLLGEHPTYQAIDAVQVGSARFNTMTPITQEFNVMLADCIKVALGIVPNNGRYTEETIEGMGYISFVSRAIEYHVLTVAGANGRINLTDNNGSGTETECDHVAGYTH